MSKELTIYVKPMPKERPRLVSGGRVYTPLKTKAYENAVALSWVAKHGAHPMTGAITIELTFAYRPPASWSKARQEASLDKGKTSRPDTDNLVKAVTDALNCIAYKDDAQIVRITASKVYADSDSVTIKIKEGKRYDTG